MKIIIIIIIIIVTIVTVVIAVTMVLLFLALRGALPRIVSGAKYSGVPTSVLVRMACSVGGGYAIL